MKTSIAIGALALAACAGSSHATLITFTGGTASMLGGGTNVTNNSVSYQGVDYYEEGGFRLDFLPNTGSSGFATNIGDYYGAGNDVIHAHWATGNFGGVTAIEITQIGGGSFDLNFFTLTSNTDRGGSPASGNEEAWVEGFVGGVSTGAAVRLPSENWGFPGTVVGLGSAFDSVDTVRFFVTNPVDCFGMDNFYINEVPAPGAAALLGLGGLLATRRRR